MTAAARRAHHHGRPTPRTKGGAEASAVLRPRRPRGREAASLPCSVRAVAAVHTPDGGDRPMRPVAWASGGGRARSARARRAQTAHEAARKARRAQCHGALAEARCHGRGGGWGAVADLSRSKSGRERARSGAMQERGAVFVTAAALWPRSMSAKVARRAQLLLELRHGQRHAAKCARGGTGLCTVGDSAHWSRHSAKKGTQMQ